MDDSISRQAAIDEITEYGSGDSVYMSVGELKRRIEQLPSAQPEIIRCRDCKHWDKTWTNNWSPDYHYCPVMDEVRKGDRYCRYKERRTDE